MITSGENPAKLGQDLFYGTDSTRKNPRKAFPLLMEAADLGDVHCQNLVGYCYASGLGVGKDFSSAIRWYKAAAKHDHPEALFALALAFDLGTWGLAPDAKRAFSLYRRAAELGHEWAQCNLAICYLDGEGVKQNLTLGIEWMRRAAKRGDARAQFNLGKAYLDGEGVRPNKRVAKVWPEKAARLSHKAAEKMLAKIVASDYAK